MNVLSERKSSSLLERWMTRLTTNALIPAHCGVETAGGQGSPETRSCSNVCFEHERAPALLAAISIEI